MRVLSVCLAGLLSLALSACSDSAEDTEVGDTGQTEAEGSPATSSPNATAPSDEADGSTGGPQVEGVTPLAERVATLGLLNKRNNVSQDIEMRPGEVREEGPIILRLASCERTAPWEMPQETGAFVQLDVLERGESEHTQVFSGWLFKESPSLNVVEHPIYDVWVKDCAMRFPGEAPEPEAG